VAYAYDLAGRRTSMQISGQDEVTYTYDAADRLTPIAQDTAEVAFAYDAADRRTSLTLPNVIVVEYGL
jgi:YD repeat-containing protein